MPMDFWAAQRKAKLVTTIYLILFVLLTLGLAFGAETAFNNFAGPDYEEPFPWIAILFCGITFVVAGYNWLMYKSQGGSYVAESVGARPVLPYTQDYQERQLLNIVHEMCIAASVPIPKVYVLDAHEINAFAAGMSKDNAAITVTRGAMLKLNRDELQGVIAHEVGHIHNGDMSIGLNIAAMVAGFYVLFIAGLRILQFASFRRDDRDGKQGNPVMLAAIVLLIAGLVAWFVGTLFRLAISRQREYLADASSVQYTRNPDGIIGALIKIGKDSQAGDMPVQGSKFAHMYFNNYSFFANLLATHPPLEKRIDVLEGKE